MGWFGVRAVAVSTAAALGVGLLPAVAVADSHPGWSPPGLKQPKAVPVKPMAFDAKAERPAATAHSASRVKVTWPAAGSADVSLAGSIAGASGRLSTGTAPAGASSGLVRAGSLPVRIGAGKGNPRDSAGRLAKVRVRVADRAAALRAGVSGLAVSVGRNDGVALPGPANVSVDYSAFRGAYGGDWSTRLHLVQLPACALTTPQAAGCTVATPLATRNDTKSSTVSASMLVPAAGSAGTVVALTADASGSSGTYKATSLKASGSWSAGGSTGAFTWSYPMQVPAVPGGLQPDVGLSYDSQSVDGLTAATNNQPSWVGDGWSYEPGYIERRYKGCNDDKDDAGATNHDLTVGDLCWYNDNATLSLGGKSTELVHDGTTWRPADDSGEKVEKLTNADMVTHNGDNDGEHWRITTTDGTQYYFGLNRLPGWKDSTTAETNSVETVPVFGNNSGEPCYNASFASGWCQQAWRWNLDYVVDPHGNAVAYYWKTETNNYGRDVNSTTGNATVTPYDRAAYLDHIDYGLRNSDAYATKAMGKVDFTTAERCTSDCGTFDAAHASSWPDVPVDLYCKDGASACTGQYSPSFWSRKRLTQVTTQVLTGGVYKDVDTWQLAQDFTHGDDGLSTPMWLDSITRGTKDSAGTFTASLPPVTFAGDQHANRVDKTGDGLAAFVRWRLYQITTETGGVIGVTYSNPGCTVTTLPPADGTNTTTCYPVKWAYEGDTAKLDWFNTYTVSQVIETDGLAATPDKVTSYTYLNGAGVHAAAWAKSTDEFTKADDRTYSVARGYAVVQTRTGQGYDPLTLSQTRYFQGIDGAAVKDSTGAAVTDREQFAGMVREKATFNGDDTSKLVSATSYTPWRSAATATRVRGDSLPDLVAYHTGVQEEDTRTTVTGGTRTTKLTRTFDTYGQTASESSTGDTAKSGDESCTTTAYAYNTDPDHWILDMADDVTSTDKTCGSTLSLPADLNGETRTYYDGSATLGAAPTKGDVTKVERINGTGTGYDQVSATPAADFDIYGRPLQVADPYGKVTTTVYTPATGEVPTKTVVTNPLGQSVATVLDPLRGQPLTVTDANNRVTTTTYDQLGRVTQVWTPARSQATYPTTPVYTFGYTIDAHGAVVTTNTLNANEVYQPSYAFYDGMLRPYETQTLSPDDSGRLVTQTLYDSRGFAWSSSGTYYTTGAPQSVPVTGQELNYPASTETVFDGAGRVVQAIAKKYGDPVETTTTGYTGDTTTVIPPAGGTATTTVVDALGRTTALREYTDAARTSYQSTLSTYNAHGQLATVKDPSGAVWSYGYDVRGRQTSADDPDKGLSTTAYDAGDRVTDVTDARGYTLHTVYDDLGRKTQLTSTYQGTTTTLSAWTYDTATGGLGQPATATQYIDGHPYTSQVVSYSTLYKPTVTQVTIPATTQTGTLAGTYKWSTAYYFTGQAKWTHEPAMGGLPDEKVLHQYSYSTALPVALVAGTDAVIDTATYDHYGNNIRQTQGGFDHSVITTQQYDEHTNALTDQFVDNSFGGGATGQRVDTTHYAYDLAQNVTSVVDTTGQDAAAVTDTQCFTTDALRRITQAWTLNTAATCDQGPSATTVGGPDAYWTSYGYDSVGDRTSEVQHTTASGPTADTTRTYAAPDAGTHDLPQVTQTGTDPHSDSYTYDADGNTATRTLGSSPAQNLTWDAQGHLSAVKQGTTTLVSYTYDTNGARLTATDATGTTLYLPDGNELLLTPAGTTVGTRYYDFNGQTVALRTGGAIRYLITDPHNTATTQIDAATLSVTRRKTTIFGAARGTADAGWQGTKGFVGGTTVSATGLTHLGARDYDPTTARFISVDPVLQTGQPQTLNGYTYAAANPLAYTDPTGTMREESRNYGSACTGACADWARQQEDADNSSGGSGKKSGGNKVSNWFKSAGKSFGHSAFGAVKTVVETPKMLRDDYRCIRGNCSYLVDDAKARAQDLAGMIWLATPSGQFEYYDDQYEAFTHGQSAQVVGTDAFNVASVLLLHRFGGEVCSFSPATPVLMEGGVTKEIAKIKIGDHVEAADPQTGKHKGSREVTGTWVNHDDDLVDVTIRGVDGKASTIHTTSRHPFWDATEHAWVPAGKLQAHHSLNTPAGPDATVLTVRATPGAANRYNLTVRDLHTYYVLAGATPVLVHNCGTGDTTPIYRTSPIEHGDSELNDGLNHANFPRTDDGSYDGAAHFGNEKTASEWAKGSVDTHGTGFRVDVPNGWLRGHIDAGRIEEWEGMTDEHMEYVIPRELFDEFNSFPRSPWSGR